MKHAIYCRQQNVTCSLQRPKIGKFVDEIEVFEQGEDFCSADIQDSLVHFPSLSIAIFVAFTAFNAAFPPCSGVFMDSKSAEPCEKVALDDDVVMVNRHDAEDIAQLLL